MVDGPGGLLGRLQQRAGGLGTGAYAAVVSGAVLAIAGLVGMALHEPWLFPSLGPTLMVLTETPGEAAAAPRNVLVGHLVGVVAGYGSLAATGLLAAPPATQEGLTAARIAAAVLSLAVTALVLQVLHAPHSPSGATTLIVSLGILTSRSDLVTLVLAVVLVTALASALNLLLGVRHAGLGG